jgi:NAD(P)-dependent dehydrogenase (short-subunit alcohol dehydrogenase family)
VYTQESFCNAVWGTTFIKIDGSYSKDDYKDFSIPKKGGIRNLSYLPKSSALYALQTKLLHCFLAKISLPTCVIGFRRNESYKSYLSPHVGNTYFLRIDIKDFFPSITDKLIASELACVLSLNTPEETDKIITLITDIVSNIGKIDGFVHAAGIEKTLPIKLLTPADYEKVFKVNSLSAFEFIHLFSNKKYFNDGGHIVLISSITAVIGRGGVAAYAASKGAMVSAVRSMALEFAKKKICINCISPGTVLTPLMQNFLSTLSEEDYKKRIDGFPLGLGNTEDIANACIYLLSDASRWVTGQNIIIDGGYTAK